jgi:hypothetical protein
MSGAKHTDAPFVIAAQRELAMNDRDKAFEEQFEVVAFLENFAQGTD